MIFAIIIYDEISPYPAVIHVLIICERPSIVLIPPMVGGCGYTFGIRLFPPAPIRLELLVRRDERRFLPVRLLDPTSGRPVIGVPYAGEHVHGFLVREEVVGFAVVSVHSYRNLVYEEHDLVVVPEYRICVVILGWIEPQHVSHLPSSHATNVHVGLQCVWLAGSVSKKFQVQFISLRSGA